MLMQCRSCGGGRVLMLMAERFWVIGSVASQAEGNGNCHWQWRRQMRKDSAEEPSSTSTPVDPPLNCPSTAGRSRATFLKQSLRWTHSNGKCQEHPGASQNEPPGWRGRKIILPPLLRAPFLTPLSFLIEANSVSQKSLLCC